MRRGEQQPYFLVGCNWKDSFIRLLIFNLKQNFATALEMSMFLIIALLFKLGDTFNLSHHRLDLINPNIVHDEKSYHGVVSDPSEGALRERSAD